MIWSGEFEKVSIGSQLNWSNENGFSIGLSLKGSLLPAMKGGYNLSGKTLRYPVFGRIFHDENNNGVLDEGENLINKKRFYQRGGVSDFTDDAGVWMDLKGLSPVSLVMTDFEDPYRISPFESKNIPVRQERVNYIDWPIIDTGSVEGSLVDRLGRVISGAHLELFELESDNKVAEMYTAYDGFFVMEFILPGKYIIYMKTEKKRIELSRVEVDKDNLWMVVELVYQSD